jgi:hypothetical protein
LLKLTHNQITLRTIGNITDKKLKGTIKLKKREKIEEITKEAEDLALERWFAISVKLFQPCGREKRK